MPWTEPPLRDVDAAHEEGRKNDANWESGVGVCYVYENADEDIEPGYTRADFERLVAAHAHRYGLEVRDQAHRLYLLCDWQSPHTLLDEDQRDGGPLWEGDEYDAYDAGKRHGRAQFKRYQFHPTREGKQIRAAASDMLGTHHGHWYSYWRGVCVGYDQAEKEAKG
jgi:hypothetical protein